MTIALINNIGILGSTLALILILKILYEFLFRSPMKLRESSPIRAIFFIFLAFLPYIAKSTITIWLFVLPETVEIIFHTLTPFVFIFAAAMFNSAMKQEEGD